MKEAKGEHIVHVRLTRIPAEKPLPSFSSRILLKYCKSASRPEETRKWSERRRRKRGKKKKAVIHKRKSVGAAGDDNGCKGDSDFDAEPAGDTLRWKNELRTTIKNVSAIRGAFKGCAVLAEHDVGHLEPHEFKYTV